MQTYANTTNARIRGDKQNRTGFDQETKKKRDGELSRLEACRGVGRDARTETETDGAMRAMRISKNRMLGRIRRCSVPPSGLVLGAEA